MPKKILFRVVYSTGWEDDYPPKDLEVRIWSTDVTFPVSYHGCYDILFCQSGA